MLEDISLTSVNVAYASTIYVLWFGWLFAVVELEYCVNRWEEPCWCSGVISERLLGEARSREHWMPCLAKCQVILS